MLTTFQVSHIQTPIGVLEVSGNERGISSLTFLNHIPKQFRNAEVLAESTVQLREYFAGDRTAFHSLKLRYPATDFQRAVWDALLQVPFGEVVTYGELAERAGHKGAARAVGTAMNVNPLPVIIPCHRVLPANKSLGEYAYGSERKSWLLKFENVNLA